MLRDVLPVPRVLSVCDRDDVLRRPSAGRAAGRRGRTEFYIMNHVAGRVYTDPKMDDASPDHRRKSYGDAVRVLAMLHAHEGWRKGRPRRRSPEGSSSDRYVSRMVWRLMEVYRVQAEVSVVKKYIDGRCRPSLSSFVWFCCYIFYHRFCHEVCLLAHLLECMISCFFLEIRFQLRDHITQ
mmetsp:Transcript_4900/g.9725  ORF Transcript_4900/g.9725 Transcript_4900/m.9725 type:complete len:181 (-) Transcript_4900:1585-2127(-)